MNEEEKGRFVALCEERIRAAEQRIMLELANQIFAVGPDTRFEHYVERPWRIFWRRLGWRWYAIREWIAEHVLRVDIGRDE